MSQDTTFQTGLAVPVAYIMCGVFIIVENSFLIYTICKNCLFAHTSYLFVASLAVTDLFVGALSLTSGVIRLPEIYGRANALLTIQLMTSTALILLSCVHMMVISIERWLYIGQPYFHQRHVTKRKIKFAIASLWCSALAYAVLLLTLQTRVYGKWPYTIVGIDTPLAMTAVCPLYLVTIASTCVFYVMILIIARRQRRQIASVGICRRKGATQYTRSIKLFLVVFGVFFVTTNGAVFAVAINTFTHVPLIVFSVSVPLVYVNSACNFLILLVMDKSFRAATRKNFSVKLCRRQEQPS